jgi:hypothetical protein
VTDHPKSRARHGMSDNPVAEIIAGAIANILEKAGAINEWKTLDGAHAIIAALEGAGYAINKKTPPPDDRGGA